MRRLAHRTHLAGLLAVATACGQARGAQGGQLSITDDANRTVSLSRPAQRVVSLSPASTELLFALGVGERVVGRTTWCDYPPQAKQVTSVGDGLSPNLEAIVARQPDLVVLYRSPLDEIAAQNLARQRIAAVVLRQDRLEDLARDARLLGTLVGKAASGDSMARRLTGVAAAPNPPLDISLAFVTWDTPPIVIGGESYLDQLAGLAGARNVFHDVSAPSSVVSLETLAVRDPDVLVTLADSNEPHPAPPAFASQTAWRAIRAVREHRFVVLGGSLFGHPSPRADSAIHELRRLLMSAR